MLSKPIDASVLKKIMMKINFESQMEQESSLQEDFLPIESRLSKILTSSKEIELTEELKHMYSQYYH